MRNDREQANILRKSGSSYSDIKTKLAIPLSTQSNWFKDQNWSKDIATQKLNESKRNSAIRLTVLNTVRGNRLKAVYQDAKQDALVDYSELKYHPLFVSGLTVYLSRGEKTSNSYVSISSSDPDIIKLFKTFLVSVCDMEKIKYQLYLGDKADENAIKSIWIEKCGLKYDDFSKSVFIKRKNISKKPTNAQKYGVCKMIVNSAYLKNKILKWLELFVKDIGVDEHFK